MFPFITNELLFYLIYEIIQLNSKLSGILESSSPLGVKKCDI